MSAPATPLLTLPLPIVDEEGKILAHRVKDVAQARNLWARLRDADLKSNVEMAKHQAMADGEPPFNQEDRRKSGQAYLSNFNPNDFKALLDTSLAAYTDLISADETLIEVYTNHGDTVEREQWSQIMSKNLSRAIRSWPSFNFQFLFIPHYFTLHGVGISYFEDCYNWQWSVSNLALVKIPRDTRACEDELPYAFAKSLTQPHKLIKYIDNEEMAAQEGWNIPALKKALMMAAPQLPDGFDWTKYAEQWKNNDLAWGETAPAVPIIYGWIRENDGSISIYVFTETTLNNPSGEKEDFLCIKRSAYKNAQEAFVFFTRGIGTNGTYHSIRGLAADIYNAMQALMRLTNREVDLAFSAGPVFQVADEESIESAMLSPWGPFMLATSGIQVMQGIISPNLQQTISPAVSSLRQTIQQNVGQYTSANALQSQREMTKAETLARLEQSATLSVTSINLFNQPMDRLAREIARRFTRKGYQRTDPGGHYVWDWVQDCIKEGVPREALHDIDHRRTRASRVIGFGSPAARRVALQLMMELYPLLDDMGKAQLTRDVTAATVGWEKANVYAPPVGADARPPIDAQIAELQNDALINEGQVSVSPSENKRVHLEVHLGKIGEFVAQFEEAGQNPEIYPQIVPPMAAIYEHAAETLEGYTGPDASQFRQALQQTGEILVNGTRHLQKLQAEQEEEAMAMQEQGGQPMQPDPQQEALDEMQRRIIEWQVKLDQGKAEFEMKREQKALDAAQERQLKDMEASAELLRKSASAQFQAATSTKAA